MWIVWENIQCKWLKRIDGSKWNSVNVMILIEWHTHTKTEESVELICRNTDKRFYCGDKKVRAGLGWISVHLDTTPSSSSLVHYHSSDWISWLESTTDLVSILEVRRRVESSLHFWLIYILCCNLLICTTKLNILISSYRFWLKWAARKEVYLL